MLESRAARWMLTFMVVITVLILGVAGAVYATFQIAARTEANLRATERATREAEDATKQSERNEAILRIILAVTGCRIEDLPAECSGRIRQASAEEGNRRIVEVDCRVRMALAGKPAPHPGEACQ